MLMSISEEKKVKQAVRNNLRIILKGLLRIFYHDEVNPAVFGGDTVLLFKKGVWS